MSKIILGLLLTLVTLLAPAPVRGQAAEELTDDEAREARELARQFADRISETNDVRPLVADLFVADFAERLRRERDQIPMNFVEPEVSRRATDEELRAFYVAQFNFFSLTLAYWMTTADFGESGEDGDDSWNLEQMYPPEVAGVLKGDPVIAGFVAKHEADEARKASGLPEPEGAQEEEADERFVKDLSTLRTATATASKAAEALRPYVPPYSSVRRKQAEEGRLPDEFEEIHTPFLDGEGCGEFGLPEGTRVIRIQVEPASAINFSLLLVRAEGRLRILHAVPVFED